MTKKLSISSFTPVSGQSAPDAIVRRLTDAITSGDLRPGDKLPRENELAKSLGVAPMTLRNALASLREFGLVVTTRGRFGGSFVASDVSERLMEAARTSSMTAQELRDLTDWRRAISGEACYLAAERGTPCDFELIQRAAVEFLRCAADLGQRRMADASLHTLIAEASRSADLLREEIQIQEKLNILILSQPTPSLAKDTPSMRHDTLISAIISRNPEGARKEMLAHVESTYNWTSSMSKAYRK